MRTTTTIALLLLLPMSLLANEQITIEAKLVEGSSADMVHDMKAISKKKGFDVVTAPQIKTVSGKEGKVVISGKDARKIQAIQPFGDIPNGVQIRVLPTKENGKIKFRGQIVVREAVGNRSEHYEIESRELYVSGIQKVGEDAWFEFAEDDEGRKIAVCIKFIEDKAEQTGAG